MPMHSTSGSGCEIRVWRGSSPRGKRRFSTVHWAPSHRRRSSEASWQGEALVALAWAIGAAGHAADRRNLRPAPDHGPRASSVGRDQGWMSDPAIVSESDAVQERELAEIWHWRATTELLRREASPADRQDYEAAIRDVAVEALDAGIVPALCDGDFPVRGRSIKEISDTDVDELVAVTGQRLRALNWLCGFGESWDDVPLDV